MSSTAVSGQLDEFIDDAEEERAALVRLLEYLAVDVEKYSLRAARIVRMAAADLSQEQAH